MPQGIFISYRREDAAPYARLLQRHLRERLPDVPLFLDLDSIEPGRDFAEVIGEALESCAVLVVLIGPRWATLADESGRRRLDNTDDYVRFEIVTALENGVRVVPVLVDGAKPPRELQLPADIARLARLNAIEISYGRYEYDADRLITLIRRVLEPPSPAEAERPTPRRDAQDDIARLLITAQHVAYAMPYENLKVRSLVKIAAAMAHIDAARAARLAADVERLVLSSDDDVKVEALAKSAPELISFDLESGERIARSIGKGSQRDQALESVAAALATVDRHRAERVAQSVTGGPFQRASALAAVAQKLARVDAAMAVRLAITAEVMSQTHRVVAERSTVQIRVAAAMAGSDMDHALRVATSITDRLDRAKALSGVVEGVIEAAADAEGIARSIPSEGWQSYALFLVVKALLVTDLDRAESVARSIPDYDSRATALCWVSTTMAPVDPVRAEQVARSIGVESQAGIALRVVAVTIADADPRRAEGTAQSIADLAQRASALAGVARVVASRDPASAARLLADSEDAAAQITDGRTKAYLQADLARTAASFNPDGAARLRLAAEHFTLAIPDEHNRVEALLRIALGEAA